MFRQLTLSRSAYGSLSKACVPFGIWGLVEKVGPVRHTEARRKVCLARRMGPLGKCALLGVWRPVKHAFFAALAENAVMGPDCMNLGTCCQETPRWGLLSGGYSSALFSENYVTWPFVELSYSVRAFAGFSLRNEVCREAPLSRFLPSGARDAARFSCDAFRRKVSSSRDWSCFEYHVFYGCEQQKRKHQIGG